MDFRVDARIVSVAKLVWCLLMTAAANPQQKAQAELDAWRAEKDGEMRASDSPLGRRLPIVLAPGSSRLGSGPENALRFESPGVPEQALEFRQEGNRTTAVALVPAVALNGELLTASAVLVPGNRLEVGPLRLVYLGGSMLSVQDAAKPELLAYKGLHYLPTDWRYRVEASFEPAESNRTLRLETTTGGERDLPFRGVLRFQVHGKPYSLEAFALGERPSDYFVIFRDASNGKKSYGAGRFLWVKGAVDGRTIVDFNQAWNPLCAYSDGFNCPLAPPENRLPIEISVGEAKYHD
jgi:uncharacterized protein (DUF1684 family)